MDRVDRLDPMPTIKICTCSVLECYKYMIYILGFEVYTERYYLAF